ncbi:hypothetical protein BZY71_00290, partial [Leclercia adecarboxylata]
RRRDAPGGHSLQGCRLVPGPKAGGNKLRTKLPGAGVARGEAASPPGTFTGDAADREVQNVR